MSEASASDPQIRAESEGAAPEVSRDTSVAEQLDAVRAEIERLDREGHAALVDEWLAVLLARR